MTPAEARTFWKALVDNASGLVTDADLLLKAGSFGRARSLTVLAQEELGKALWVYETFEQAWSSGDETPRTVDKLKQRGRDHVHKYATAFIFGDELAMFWGDYSDLRQPEEGETWEAAHVRWSEEAGAAADQTNRDKQAGFYVDRDGQGQITSPADVVAGSIAADLQTAAQVIEMLLIKDHTRMKHDASTPYDSTHEQQHRLLPISHPEDWAAAPEWFRASGGRLPQQDDG